MKRSKFVLTNEVKNALRTGEPIESIGSSNGFWYDITDGGYVHVSDLIADPKQIAKIEEALETILELQSVYNEVTYDF